MGCFGNSTERICIERSRVPMTLEDFDYLSRGAERIREKGGVIQGSWKNKSDLSGVNPANPNGRFPANVLAKSVPFLEK